MVRITPEAEPQLPVPIDSPVVPRRGFGWGTLFWGAVAGLVLLGLGLGTVNLIEDLFARSEGLGLLGIALTAAAALALGVITMRELTALVRLATIEKLHARAAAVLSATTATRAAPSCATCSSWRTRTHGWRAPVMRWPPMPRTSSTAPT